MNNITIKSERFCSLRPILKEWIAINDRIGREWAKIGDAPWWHIERALVSIFAGAVWRKKGDAMEEYGEHKRGDLRKSSGRIDLWFSYRKEDYKAEAKQCWLRANPLTALQRAKECMERAKRDAASLDPDGMRRLAMVFGCPIIPKSQLSNLSAHLESLETMAVNKSIGADAVAWTFPTLSKPLMSSDGYICPGLILWIKEVRRSKR